LKRSWRERLKLATIIALIAVASLGVGIVIGQNQNNLVLVKPLSVPVAVTDPSVRVISLTYSYDPESDRITAVDVRVGNMATESRSIVVHVLFYDNGGNIIARGSATDTIGGGVSKPVRVALTWSSGKTVNDLASARITIEQTQS